jgi:hypothetical protein
MARLIACLERVKPPELSELQFVGICLCAVASALLILVFGGPQ